MPITGFGLMRQTLKRGPVLTWLSNRLSDDAALRIEVLNDLRITELSTVDILRERFDLDDPRLVRWAAVDGVDLLDHLQSHWIDGAQSDTDQPETWIGWRGDADTILRETFIRTIEASLGLFQHHGAGSYAKSSDFDISRKWDIDLSWIASAPTFQSSITWRPVGNSGIVMTTLLTPPAAFAPIDVRFAELPASIDDLSGYALSPDNGDDSVGQVVIGQRQAISATGDLVTDQDFLSGQAFPIHGQGPVLAITPAFLDGGVFSE